MFRGYSSAHIANILLHILGGTVALVAGLLALPVQDACRLHRHHRNRSGYHTATLYAMVSARTRHLWRSRHHWLPHRRSPDVAPGFMRFGGGINE